MSGEKHDPRRDYIGKKGAYYKTHIFVDKAGNPHECWEAPSGMVNVVISMTPEQAIMLGTETCHNTESPRFTWSFTCSECGTHSITQGNSFNFCPNCGRKVVDE